MESLSEPLLLKVDEAAHRLNVSRAHAYRLVLDGTIPSIKLGNSRRVPREALEAWMREQLAASRGR